MNVRDAVVTILSAKGDLPARTEAELLACNYIDELAPDSLGVLQIVLEVEEEFGIRFSAEDLESEEFKKIGGLIKTIERLVTQGPQKEESLLKKS